MTYSNLQELIRSQPFQPFTITTSDGREFTVPHPETCLLTKTRFLISTDGINTDFISLLHIVSARVSEDVASDPSSEAA